MSRLGIEEQPGSWMARKGVADAVERSGTHLRVAGTHMKRHWCGRSTQAVQLRRDLIGIIGHGAVDDAVARGEEGDEAAKPKAQRACSANAARHPPHGRDAVGEIGERSGPVEMCPECGCPSQARLVEVELESSPVPPQEIRRHGDIALFRELAANTPNGAIDPEG